MYHVTASCKRPIWPSKGESTGNETPRYILNQTDCRADTTVKGFIWANISTSTTSLLQGQSFELKCYWAKIEDVLNEMFGHQGIFFTLKLQGKNYTLKHTRKCVTQTATT